MKICHATNYLPHYHTRWGGAEQATYRLVKLLAKKGHEVSVLSTKPIKKVNEEFDFFKIKTLEGCFGGKFSNITKNIKYGFFPFDPVSFVESYKILKKIKADILHLHNINLLSFSLLESAKRLGIPTVLTIYDYWYFCPVANLFKLDHPCREFHGSNCEECLKVKGLSYPMRLSIYFRKPVFDYFLNKIDGFITLSNSSSNILKSYGIKKEKIYNIPIVFSVKKVLSLKQKVKPDEKMILYVGWWVRHKGLHILIKAMPKILKKISDVRLVVIGDKSADKEYVDKIGELVERLDLKRNISFLGKVSDEVLHEHYNKTGVTVILEQWENMSPVVLIDNMLLEKPIVASRIGGIPEFIVDGKSGLLSNPRNPDDFAEKIVFMLENRKAAINMGKNAKKRVLGIFDENSLLEKLMSVYENIQESLG